jgi:hypothetical protein
MEIRDALIAIALLGLGCFVGAGITIDGYQRLKESDPQPHMIGTPAHAITISGPVTLRFQDREIELSAEDMQIPIGVDGAVVKVGEDGNITIAPPGNIWEDGEVVDIPLSVGSSGMSPDTREQLRALPEVK